MIDQLRAYLHPIPRHRRLNHLREYLQWLVLRTLDAAGYRKALAFQGGTALRIAYGNDRFSEDLDFSRAAPLRRPFGDFIDDVEQRLAAYGLKTSHARTQADRTVASSFLRFHELLHPLGLASNPNQPLAIKIEIDMNPPHGGSIVEYHVAGPLLFTLNLFDLPTLFAGKLHAVLFRRFTKGRDYYDLLFYLRKKTSFNLPYFTAAARRTNPGLRYGSCRDVIEALDRKLAAINEARIVRDVQPFLLRPEESQYLTRDFLRGALRRNLNAGVYR